MLRFILQLIVFFLAIFPYMGWAMTGEKVNVVIYDNSIPYEFKDENGNAKGYIIDYLVSAGHEAGFVPVFLPSKGDEGIALYADKIDVVSMVTGKYSTMYADCVKTEHIFTNEFAAIVLENSEFKNTEDLKNKKIGYFGWECEPSVDQIFRAKTVDFYRHDTGSIDSKLEYGYKSLSSSKVDAIVVSKEQLGQLFFRHPEYRSTLRVIKGFQPGKSSQYLILQIPMNKNSVVNLVSKGINSVKNKGVEAELSKKWFGF